MTMTDLLAAIESGEEVRFDNRRRPQLLPKVHPFHVTCTCFECERVWTERADG